MGELRCGGVAVWGSCTVGVLRCGGVAERESCGVGEPQCVGVAVCGNHGVEESQCRGMVFWGRCIMWGLWWLPNLNSLRFRRFSHFMRNLQQTNYFKNSMRLNRLPSLTLQ